MRTAGGGGWWRGEGGDGAALGFGGVVGDLADGLAGAVALVGRGAGAVDHLRGGDGVVAGDDLAGDVDGARAGERAVRAHGELDGVGVVLEDDVEGGGRFVDGVGAAGVDECAALLDGGGVGGEVEAGGGAVIEAAEDDAGTSGAEGGGGVEAEHAEEAADEAFAHAGGGVAA